MDVICVYDTRLILEDNKDLLDPTTTRIEFIGYYNADSGDIMTMNDKW